MSVTGLPLEREAFLDAVRREEPSSIEGYGLGDLNHVYGYQWRSWPRPDGGCIDQIRQVIDQIKHSPDSRRMLVSAWNVAEVDDMALPPCHVLFQFTWPEGAFRVSFTSGAPIRFWAYRSTSLRTRC